MFPFVCPLNNCFENVKSIGTKSVSSATQVLLLHTQSSMRFLVIDFETTGVGKDATNGYRSYLPNLAPLPRADYPVQLAAELLDEKGDVLASTQMLIVGAERLDPWVLEHCPNLSVHECEREGVSLSEAIRTLTDLIGDDDLCTLVAHNIQYDWDAVMLRTARDLNIDKTADFLKLASLTRYCTCINRETKRAKTSYFFSKLGKWIGPKLGDLAKECGVEYNTDSAHDAAYDVRVTSSCLAKQLKEGVSIL